MNVEMFYIGGATCVIKIEDKIKIGIDPALAPKGHKINFKSFTSIKEVEPYKEDGLFENMDLWLITHTHEDHFDQYGKNVISPNVNVICESEDSRKKIEHNRCKILHWGECYQFTKENIKIEIIAVPAYHGQNFIIQNMVGKVNGYIVKVIEGDTQKSIYFTGDTVFKKKIVKAIKEPIDLMVANLGNVKGNSLLGALTMNLEMLGKFKARLQPTKIVPVHIDDYSHYEMSKEQVKNAGYEILPYGKWVKVIS